MTLEEFMTEFRANVSKAQGIYHTKFGYRFDAPNGTLRCCPITFVCSIRTPPMRYLNSSARSVGINLLGLSEQDAISIIRAADITSSMDENEQKLSMEFDKIYNEELRRRES